MTESPQDAAGERGLARAQFSDRNTTMPGASPRAMPAPSARVSAS